MKLPKHISWCIRRALCLYADQRFHLLIDIAEIEDSRCRRYQVMFRDVHERRFEHFSNWYFDEMTRTIGDWPTSPSAAFAHWRHCFLQYFDNPAHIRKDERWVAQEIDRRMWPDEIG